MTHNMSKIATFWDSIFHYFPAAILWPFLLMFKKFFLEKICSRSLRKLFNNMHCSTYIYIPKLFGLTIDLDLQYSEVCGLIFLPGDLR